MSSIGGIKSKIKSNNRRGMTGTSRTSSSRRKSRVSKKSSSNSNGNGNISSSNSKSKGKSNNKYNNEDDPMILEDAKTSGSNINNNSDSDTDTAEAGLDNDNDRESESESYEVEIKRKRASSRHLRGDSRSPSTSPNKKRSAIARSSSSSSLLPSGASASSNDDNDNDNDNDDGNHDYDADDSTSTSTASRASDSTSPIDRRHRRQHRSSRSPSRSHSHSPAKGKKTAPKQKKIVAPPRVSSSSSSSSARGSSFSAIAAARPALAIDSDGGTITSTGTTDDDSVMSRSRSTSIGTSKKQSGSVNVNVNITAAVASRTTGSASYSSSITTAAAEGKGYNTDMQANKNSKSNNKNSNSNNKISSSSSARALGTVDVNTVATHHGPPSSRIDVLTPRSPNVGPKKKPKPTTTDIGGRRELGHKNPSSSASSSSSIVRSNNRIAASEKMKITTSSSLLLLPKKKNHPILPISTATATATAMALETEEGATSPPDNENTAADTMASVLALADATNNSKETDWKSVQKELDELFVKQSKDRMKGVPLIEMPKILVDNINGSGMQLFDHQKDGIRWLTHKELTNDAVPPYYKIRKYGPKLQRYVCSLDNKMCRNPNGPEPLRHSILADDMGLGKTLQSIGLILSNPPAGRNGIKAYPYKMPRRSEGNAAAAVAPRCTIIVSPVSVMSNWKMEIDKFVHKEKKNILKIEIYQGAKRVEVLRKVQDGKLDILICSYQTLAADLKKQKQQQEDEAELDKSEARAKKESATAAAANLGKKAAIDDADEFDFHAGHRRPKRKIVKKRYAEDGGSDDDDSNSDFDESDAEEEDNSDDEDCLDDEEEIENPIIFDQQFHRIILDEAHTIRNNKTGYFQSVKALNATHKLCLTGTPFVNHPRDIHSFLDFLEVAPLNDIKLFNERVVGPIEERKEVGLARLRVLMGALAIRRTKKEVDHKIKITKKEVQIREIPFPDYCEHKHVSEMMYHTCRTAFLALSQSGNGKFGKKAFRLFGMVLRVRQSCCDASLIPAEVREEVADLWKEFRDVNIEYLSEKEGMALFEKLVDALSTAKERIEAARIEGANSDDDDGDDDSVLLSTRNIKSGRNRSNKSGRNRKIGSESMPLVEREGSSFVRSPKVQALMDAIGEMKLGEKGVIFSQWTQFLDIIQNELEIEGHTITRIDGSMNATARYEAMRKFATEGCDTMETPRFILCSLKACGTGITLTRANHVFMMDTWWNVAEENQAMDRVHRIGQTRPVRAIRFIMKNSIEERFINVQDAKQCLGKGSMERLKKEDRSKANITAMKDLFEMKVQAHVWEGVFLDDDIHDDDGADLKDFIVSDDVED